MTLKGEAKTRYMRDYMRRRRAGQAAQPKPSVADGTSAKLEARIRELTAELAQAHKRIADLERRSEGQLTRGRREGPFSEVGKLRAEIAMLKSDIIKLKAALQEEPDADKLRKKVIEQRMEMASLRREMKRLAKERDTYRTRTLPKFREASRMATRETYNVIIKALHSDRAKHASAAELAEAERLFIALKPLFDEGRR